MGELEDAPRPSRSVRAARPRGVTSDRPPDRPPPAESTRIMSVDDLDRGDDAGPSDGDATHAGPPITVEVVAGPDAGLRKPVRGGRMVIGRGDGCDLKLRDTATSRRHLELIVGMSGAVVRDLGSGNGTRVNGERIDEVQVGHADEIAVGTTVLRVIDELVVLEERRRPRVEPPPHVEPADFDEEPSAAPARSRAKSTALRAAPHPPGTEAIAVPAGPLGLDKRKLILLGGLGGGALLLVGALVLLLRPAAKPAPPPVDDDKAAALVKDGKAAVAAGDYDKANADWDALEKVDSSYADLADLRARTAKEKAAKTQLDAAQGMLVEHRWDDARAALKAISPDVLVFDKAAQVQKGIDAKESAFLVGEAGKKLAASDLDGARAVAEKLAKLSPDDSDRIMKAVASAQADQEESALKHVRNRRQRARMIRAMRKRKAEEAVRQELLAGYRKFSEASTPGGYERSASAFERISESTQNAAARTKARSLAGRVRTFSKNLSDANQLDADQSYEAEVAPLDRALAALRAIDPSSPMKTRLKNRMVRGLVIKGQNAGARQDYATAAKSFSAALALKPTDSNARAGMASLHARAHDVYLQAYEDESHDPAAARKLYRAVLQMVGQGEELYGKAKHRLDLLNSGNTQSF